MRSERGSALPLGIGLISLTLLAVFLFVELTGVSLQALRNKQLADVSSLKVAGDLLADGIPPLVGLDYSPAVRDVLASAANHMGVAPTKVIVLSLDGQTLETEICTQWKSITGLTFGNFGHVCSKSKARAVS
jgi:hypothetical protein